MFFNRKSKFTPEPGTLYAITGGRTVKLENVNDDVFSQKILGDGIAFYSDDGIVCAPCDGKVGMIAETGHAIGITTADGAEIIIHIGIDTAEQGGKGFKTYIKEGESVSAGQKLVAFDRKMLTDKGYDLVIPLLISDAETYAEIAVCAEKSVKVKEPVVRYSKEKSPGKEEK